MFDALDDQDDPFAAEFSEEEISAALPEPAARVSQEIQEQSSRILANWSLRVTTIPEFRATPDLNLAQLQEGMPELLDAAIAAIAASEPTLDPSVQERIEDLATAHGQRRANDGYSIGVLIAELQALRTEAWAAILRVIESDPALSEVPVTMQDRLARTFDPLIVEAAEAWVATAQSGETANPPD